MLTGRQIRDARKRAGLSQGELAKMVGVSLRTVGGWERGENSPNLAEPRLLDALGSYLDRPGASEQSLVERLTDMELLSELGRRLSRRAVTDEEWQRLRAYEEVPDLVEGEHLPPPMYTIDSENPHPKDSVGWRRFEDSRQSARESLEVMHALYDGGIRTNDPRAAAFIAKGRPVNVRFSEAGEIQFEQVADVEVGATGGGIAQMRPRTGPPEPPDEAPAPPLDAAANDPGVPSVGEQKRDRQDRAAEETD